jgi:mRNA interferase RelE/StbE
MGRYKVEVKRSAVKEIEALPGRDIRDILDRISSLSDNPRPYDCRKLSGRTQYRIRRGNYRILYYIDDTMQVVCIVKVGHRKNVYGNY